jgi:hypothetical protein
MPAQLHRIPFPRVSTTAHELGVMRLLCCRIWAEPPLDKTRKGLYYLAHSSLKGGLCHGEGNSRWI